MKTLHIFVQSLVVLLILSQHQTMGNPLTGFLEIISAVTDIATIVFAAWDSIQLDEEGNTIIQLRQDKQRQVFDLFKQVSKQIDQTEAKNSQHIAMATESINSFISQNVPLLIKYNDIMDTMNRISSRYQLMLRYETHRDKLENNTLITFAEWTISPNPFSVAHLMNRLHLALFRNGIRQLNASSSENVLSQLTYNYEISRKMWHTNQSAQQFLYTLYSDIALTELKGYTMIEFSFMILRIYGKGNYTQEAELLRWDYVERTENSVNLLRTAMRVADRTLWRCDPIKHIPKVTYDEVTRLLQGFIKNEELLNSGGTCLHNCAHYVNARDYTSDDELFCTEAQGNCFCGELPKCFGEVRNCQFVESHMMLCKAPRNAKRRYEYIEYDNGRVLGQRNYCARGANRLESWWDFFWHCSYCFCLCDEKSTKSDRYFNLREFIADIKQNKVLTGLRFVKKNRVFHLQIQQGKLLPLGVIDETTLDWKPLDEYHIDNANIAEGVDYHTMKYSSRSIDLDNIMNTGDNSFVVTGVRFRVLGSHLNLMARFCKFDFKTGKLLRPKINCKWQSSDVGSRRQLNIDNLDVPTRSIANSLPLSEPDHYLEFVNSGMDQDAAQTTIPFIDIQEVVSNPPVPLAGIGIHYKSRPGYGGFIAPKITTYDFSQHVQAPRTKPENFFGHGN